MPVPVPGPGSLIWSLGQTNLSKMHTLSRCTRCKWPLMWAQNMCAQPKHTHSAGQLFRHSQENETQVGEMKRKFVCVIELNVKTNFKYRL